MSKGNPKSFEARLDAPDGTVMLVRNGKQLVVRSIDRAGALEVASFFELAARMLREQAGASTR